MAVALSAVVASLANGATLYQDLLNGNGFGTNADFTWSTSNTSWNTNSNGNSGRTAWNNATLYDAQLGTGSGTSTYTANLGSAITVGRILVTRGTWNIALNGNTLTFNSGTNWTFGGTGFGVISGSGNVVKSGSNNLTFSANNTYTGSTTITQGTLTLSGTLASSAINITGGTLSLNSNHRLSDSAAVTIAGGTLALGSYSDTVGSFAISSGTLGGSGTLTASTYALQGGTVSANLGSGTATVTSGTTTLGGTLGAATVNINSGTLALGSSNRISDSAAINLAGGTLALGSYSDTVGSFAISSGTLGGSGTLTASTYALQGGTVSANLGSGIATVTSGTTTLNGTLGAATVNINSGTLALGSDNRISDSAAINLAGGTLDIGGFNDTVGSVTWSSGSIDGSGILSASSFNFTNDSNLTVSARLGGGSLIKTGSGDLTLSGSNTYTGTTTISAGTLQIGNGGTTGSIASTSIVNDSNLAFNRADALAYAGAISGSGSLTKLGSGTLTLTGANTYTGATTINNGTLTLDGSGVLSNPDIVVNATSPGTTATFALASAATQTINSFTFGGAGATSTSTNTVSLETNSVLTLGGDVTYLATNNPLGSTISGSGTLSLGSSQRTFDIGNSTNAATDLAISSNITGTGGILKTGDGTLALSGSNNTFSGGVAVNQGTLLAIGTTTEGGFKALGDYSSVVVPTTVVTVHNGATLAVQNTTPGFIMPEEHLAYDLRTISLSGHGADGQGALQSFGGRNSWVGHTSLAGDTTIQNHVGGDNNTLFLGTFTPIPSNRLELNDHALTFIGAGDVYVASSVGNSAGDTGSLTVNLTNGGYGTGVNSITLAGPQNFYTGETRVDNGWLRLMVDAGNHPNAAVLGSLTIGDGIGGANTAVVTNYYIEQIADDVAVTIKSDGLLDLASASVNETLSNITLQGGRITTGTGNLYMTGTIKAETAATSTIDGNIGMLNAGGGPARIFDVDANSTLLLNARIFGGDYNKTGDGRMIVTVDSLSSGYSGITTVQDGILTLRHSAGLGQHNNGAESSGTVVQNGATLQLEQVTLPAGTVLLQGSYAPNGGSKLPANATLLSDTTYNINVAYEALTLAGAGHNGQGALQNLSGDNSWTNATITLADSATINTTAGSLTIGGRIGSTAGAGETQTLTITGAGNTTITGAIKDNIGPAPTYSDLHTGTLDLVKNDSGTLTLSGVNTFTGAININEGTLAVTANNSLAAQTNAVAVQSGATFALSGGNNYTNTIGRLEGTGVVSIASATVLKVDNTTANTFDGRLSGQGLFDKIGSGTFTFSSTANTDAFHFDGTVRLSNGTLEFAGGSGVLNTSIDALFIDTLELTGGTLLLSEAFINIGTLNITGDTILDFGATGHSILNADNIYIAAGAVLTIRNWTSEVDFLFANHDFRQIDENGTLAIFNQIGTTPQNQVHFEGDPQSPDGRQTTWINYGYDGFTNWEIRPIPEPSTYGALLTAVSLVFLFYRRSRKAKSQS